MCEPISVIQICDEKSLKRTVSGTRSKEFSGCINEHKPLTYLIREKRKGENKA